VTTAPVNGFDQQIADDKSDRHRHFAANVQQILREDYRLRGHEADLAFGRYLRRQTRWVTPDEAAYDAYLWWTPTVDPTVVLTRESEQRAHARVAGDTDNHRTDAQPVEPARIGDGADRPRTDMIESDLAAAESALSLIRGQGQRHGFTDDHVELVGQLKQLLDDSPLWDTITPDTSVREDRAQTPPLERALQPDSVWSGDDWDDMIVLDAAFAGTVITANRVPATPVRRVWLAMLTAVFRWLRAELRQPGSPWAGPARVAGRQPVGPDGAHLVGPHVLRGRCQQEVRNGQQRTLRIRSRRPRSLLSGGRRSIAGCPRSVREDAQRVR